MNIPTKKLQSGFEIPALALGTWQMGGLKNRIENYNPEQDIEAIRNAFKQGMTRFDTAQIYADGLSEEILGKALSIYDRNDYFVSSKVHGKDLSYKGVLAAIKRTLSRLNMEYIDLYMIHWPDPSIPLEETLKAFQEIKDAGLIKNIGVCNFGTKTLQKAQELLNSPIALNQVHYNLMFREPQLEGVLDYCQNNDIFIEAWRPLQEGSLCKSGIQQIDEMCEKYKKTPSQISLNWLLSQKNILTLFKSSNIEHITENLGAVGWEMDQEDVEELKMNFIIQLDRSNAVRLG